MGERKEKRAAQTGNNKWKSSEEVECDKEVWSEVQLWFSVGEGAMAKTGMMDNASGRMAFAYLLVAVVGRQ